MTTITDIKWSAEVLPKPGDLFVLAGAIKVVGWDAGDTLKVVEMFNPYSDSDVALCLNITKNLQDYIDLSRLV